MACNGTHRREQAIAALLQSASIPEAAMLSGVGVRTLLRYLSEEGFKAEFEAAKRSLVESAVNQLRLASRGAVDVLVKIAHDECASHASRVQAARSIIALCIDAASLQDLETRLRQLEQEWGKTIDGRPEWSDNDGYKVQSIA